jgi:DNA-binding transcriptional ArsR family regulator
MGEPCEICGGSEKVIKICLQCTKHVDYRRVLILAALSGSRTGLTITQIMIRTGMHRNTISTHIGGMEADGLVVVKHYGQTKLCQLPKQAAEEL